MKIPTTPITKRLTLLLPLFTLSSATPAPTPELTGIPGPAGINLALSLSAFQLSASPGLPTLASLNLTAADLLSLLCGLSARSSSDLVGFHPRAACIPNDFPLAVGSLSSYMWERTAVRAAYNYLRAMGEAKCSVPKGEGATVFVEGMVDGYYVQVMGMAGEGMGAAGEEGSWCQHVAYGMEAYMVRDAGCCFPMGGYVVNGGAAKAWGNGGLWVYT
ncbi:hypothetical protein B0T18DRAFT_430067 [Schizothecium vesticola]|uniref:SCP domain-containing protein n=1 Tax=Schizothecium vesticola TaxID=314040 RepID=A0AA40ENL1_9PEZI|nr:hypothetical protein B0T18DRAFT_430067 [Schizothecium vesticola]